MVGRNEMIASLADSPRVQVCRMSALGLTSWKSITWGCWAVSIPLTISLAERFSIRQLVLNLHTWLGINQAERSMEHATQEKVSFP
jgi:hypothetical protein